MTPDDPNCAQWYLRMGDATTYGPVAFEVLRSWAAQARVGPGTQVSSDGTTWVAPETVRELELEWMVLVRNRNPYGPLHRHGLAQLARDRTIAPDTRVLHVGTRQEIAVSELVADAAKSEPDEARVAADKQRAAEAAKAIQAAEEERHRLEEELGRVRQELQNAVDEARRAGEEERRKFEFEMGRVRQELQNAVEEARQVREAADRDRASRERIEAERDGQERAYLARATDLEQQVQSLTTTLAREQALGRQHEAELAATGGHLARVERDLAEARAATQQAVAELAAEREGWSRAKGEWADQQARLEGQAEALLHEAVSAARPAAETAPARKEPCALAAPLATASRPAVEGSAARTDQRKPTRTLLGRSTACPACGSTSVCRVYRVSWMRALVLSRRYACDDCGCGFVLLFGFVKVRLT